MSTPTERDAHDLAESLEDIAETMREQPGRARAPLLALAAKQQGENPELARHLARLANRSTNPDETARVVEQLGNLARVNRFRGVAGGSP